MSERKIVLGFFFYVAPNVKNTYILLFFKKDVTDSFYIRKPEAM